MSEPERADLEHRLLLLAPTARDAANSQKILTAVGVTCAVCHDLREVAREMARGAGAVLVTEEALADEESRSLTEALARQPPWSDLPILVLTRGGADSGAARRASEVLGNVILLELPVRVPALVSAVQSALRARRRQYEIRAHLAAQEQNQQRLALALHAGRLGAWQFHLGTDVLELSSICKALFGFPPEASCSSQDLVAAIHDDDRHLMMAAFRRTVDEAREYDVEYRVIWPDGSLHWLMVRAELKRGDDGRPLQLVGVSLDITERKRQEEAQRLLAEASAVFSAPLTDKVVLERVARLALPMLGDYCYFDVLTPEGALARAVWAHVDPEAEARLRGVSHFVPPVSAADHPIIRAMQRREPELHPHVDEAFTALIALSPEHRHFMEELDLRSLLVVPLNASERALGALTFGYTSRSRRHHGEAEVRLAQDLAQRTVASIENIRLYQELKEADRRKDEFLAMLAHELRNPLAPVRSALHILGMQGVGAAASERARQMIERQVHHLVRLVDDLLDVSRIMRDKVELRRERVDLRQVVERAVETVQPLIESQRHTLSIELPSAPVWLDADAVRLAQVIANLLNNAAKYTDPGGRIALRAEREGDEAVIRVRDNGVGIAPDALVHVFDLFMQAERSIARSQGGLGIGLTLVRRLVEMHGGRVMAVSAGLGQGSELVIRLPALPEASAAAEPQPGQAAPEAETRRRRVLVVDDNVDVADSLAMLLELLEHDVAVAHDGLEAIDKAESFRPAVILLDIGLPGLSGYDTARRLRERPEFRDTLLVALTGYGQEEDRRRSREAGFDHHLVKPVNPDDLVRLIGEPGRGAP
jgi:PAS domain S-box-containing protein